MAKWVWNVAEHHNEQTGRLAIIEAPSATERVSQSVEISGISGLIMREPQRQALCGPSGEHVGNAAALCATCEGEWLHWQWKSSCYGKGHHKLLLLCFPRNEIQVLHHWAKSWNTTNEFREKLSATENEKKKSVSLQVQKPDEIKYRFRLTEVQKPISRSDKTFEISRPPFFPVNASSGCSTSETTLRNKTCYF